MNLIVLYREDGRIVSLSKTSSPRQQDADGIPSLSSSVEPGKGQRVAILDLDPSWHGRPLEDIHEHFVVARKGDTARLKERGSKS